MFVEVLEERSFWIMVSNSRWVSDCQSDGASTDIFQSKRELSFEHVGGGQHVQVDRVGLVMSSAGGLVEHSR